MSKALDEFLVGKSAMAPAELFLSVSPHAVVLYLLIRSLGEGRDTFRSKTSIAAALGWNRKTVYKVAGELEEAGWLERKSTNRKGRWRSTWTVLHSPTKRDRSHETGPVPRNGTGPSKRDRTSPTNRDRTSPTKWDKNTPPLPTRNTPTNAGGSSPSSFLSESEAWSLIPSSDRDAAPAGVDRLREGMRELLDAGELRPASVVWAFATRIRDPLPLGRVSSPTRLLAAAARKADPVVAADWLEERRRVCAPKAAQRDPAPEVVEPFDPSAALEALASAKAVPGRQSRPSSRTTHRSTSHGAFSASKETRP